MPWLSIASYCLIWERSWPPFSLLMVFFRPFKPRISDVMLSRLLLAAAALIMISTPSAAAWCSLYSDELPLFPGYFLFRFTSLFPPLWSPPPPPILLEMLICSVIWSQISSTQSLLFSRSKMPSQPIMMKSKLSCTLKVVISGSQTITLGLPPYFGRLASISPKVFDTLSLPGKTRSGPWTYKSFSPGWAAAFAKVYVL